MTPCALRRRATRRPPCSVVVSCGSVLMAGEHTPRIGGCDAVRARRGPARAATFADMDANRFTPERVHPVRGARPPARRGGAATRRSCPPCRSATSASPRRSTRSTRRSSPGSSPRSRPAGRPARARPTLKAEHRPRPVPRAHPCPLGASNGRGADRTCGRSGVGDARDARGGQRLADAALAPVQGAADAQRGQPVGARGEQRAAGGLDLPVAAGVARGAAGSRRGRGRRRRPPRRGSPGRRGRSRRRTRAAWRRARRRRRGRARSRTRRRASRSRPRSGSARARRAACAARRRAPRPRAGPRRRRRRRRPGRSGAARRRDAGVQTTSSNARSTRSAARYVNGHERSKKNCARERSRCRPARCLRSASLRSESLITSPICPRLARIPGAPPWIAPCVPLNGRNARKLARMGSRTHQPSVWGDQPMVVPKR